MVGKSRQAGSVHFYFNNVDFSLKDRRRLRNFIRTLATNEKRKIVNVNYIFCTDKAVLEINRSYLDHDYSTDVITFDLSSSPAEIMADIYVSAQRVRANAKSLKTSFKEELHRVMFHGLLHLCGYNDKTEKERDTMRHREDYYLKRYFR